ncbi:hypothetical protein [Klebsiella phage KL01]|uniref:Uncharacterized protein n=3 Tax=root TaxID=1 RepID=A0ABQ1SYR5_9SPHI|nr:MULTISPECIES: hypothetical protein [Sphingobacteriaceae]WNV46807.1 hypothetical protein [Klebsiella phage KL01]GGE71441.1 hypothetical protein GCM10011413_42750 [Pedobacter psychrotolerans]GGH32526.1 hypothetical protein GCM10011418_46090 [Sphingobacterium alkalisoli]
MKLIGKGAFTKAYLLDNGRVQLHSCCPFKECMAHGWFPESDLFPKLTFIDVGVYEMDYLTSVTAPKRQLNEASYKLYKALQLVYGDYDAIDYFSIYKSMEKHLEGFKELEEVLEALDACSNWGTDIGFEISPRNISVDDKGNLILADCFFHRPTLTEVRSRK